MEKLNFTTAASLPDATTVPTGYVMHYYTTTCGHCAAQSSRSDFWALHLIRSRLEKALVKHLVRCDRPTYNLPVERIKVGHRQIPYCADCTVIDLSHLPSAPNPAALHNIVGVSSSPPRDGAAPRKPTPTAAQPRKATLGDLA